MNSGGPLPFVVNPELMGFLNDDEFEHLIAYRPGPHFLRPDLDIGEPEGAVDFFDVGEPGWGDWEVWP
jgi:hypothetical protein